MNSRNKRIEIVTPVHNRRDLTIQCLRSIARLNTEGLDVHTIIVDDGSSDGTSEAIREEFPHVEVIRGDGNLWFTEGTNVGMKRALERDPDYILTINDDQVFDSDALRYMVEAAEEHERSIVGSLLLLWDTPHRLFQVAPVWSTMMGGWRHWYRQTVWTIPKRPWTVDLIVGNCVLFPIEAVRENGLMNSRRYPNFGDAEYTPRLRKRGWRLVIEPRARVFCQPNDIPAKVRKMTVGEKLKALFLDLGNVHNIRRRFYANWDGAPNRLHGVIAFIMFFIRLAAGRNIEGAWASEQDEPPLAEMYADRELNASRKS